MRDDATLATARAAVLARLWGALAREPIAGLGPVEAHAAVLTRKLPDGRMLSGDAATAAPFAIAPAGFSVHIDRVAHDDPVGLVRALGLAVPVDRLADELADSVANLARARAAQPGPDGGTGALPRARATPDPLAYLEQSVVDGHPLHPCCRSRIGLTPAQLRAYAPEYRPVVELVAVRVPVPRWVGWNAPPTLLMHPWQSARLLEHYPWLAPTGSLVPARPLMSLRTLALVEQPHRHVKTAIDVQMTSAVRTVSPAAIHNGPRISALLARLVTTTPGLRVLPEVGAGAVLVDGEPCRSLAMLRRERPALGPGELAMPMAALAAPAPSDGRAIAHELAAGYPDPLAFVRDLAGLVMAPLLTLLALGVALEAHGQNLLLVVRGRRPVGLLYRDFGGVRISPYRLRRHGIEAPSLRGDLVCDDADQLRAKLVAAAVATVLAEVIAVLAGDGELDPALAWAAVADAVRTADLPAAAGADVASLLGDPLPIKAMTAMRLAADPVADIWATLPNPMSSR